MNAWVKCAVAHRIEVLDIEISGERKSLPQHIGSIVYRNEVSNAERSHSARPTCTTVFNSCQLILGRMLSDNALPTTLSIIFMHFRLPSVGRHLNIFGILHRGLQHTVKRVFANMRLQPTREAAHASAGIVSAGFG